MFHKYLFTYLKLILGPVLLLAFGLNFRILFGLASVGPAHLQNGVDHRLAELVLPLAHVNRRPQLVDVVAVDAEIANKKIRETELG